MKQVVFIGNHKNFNTARLGLYLAQRLQACGRWVVLGGNKGTLPENCPAETFTVGATVSAKTLAAAFKKNKAQQIISVGSLKACQAAAQAKIPYVYIEPENFKEEKTVKEKPLLLKNAQKVIVISESEKALDKKRYGKNTVRVKNPAVWVEHFSGLRPMCFRKQNNLLAQGDLVKGSGMDNLLTVWAKLAAAHYTWQLTIVGEGAQKPALKKLVANYKLQDSVQFASAAQLPDLLAHADIYLHPSADNAEQILDALASKLPVAAAKSAAAGKLITDGVNGYLLPADNLKAWQKAVDRLLVNWDLRVKFALEGAKLRAGFPGEMLVCLVED